MSSPANITGQLQNYCLLDVRYAPHFKVLFFTALDQLVLVKIHPIKNVSLWAWVLYFFYTNCPVIIKGNKKTKAKEQKTVSIKIAHIPSAASHSTANLCYDVESQNKAQKYWLKLSPAQINREQSIQYTALSVDLMYSEWTVIKL